MSRKIAYINRLVIIEEKIMIKKNLFAKATLLAPKQFPMITVATSIKPYGTNKSIFPIF